MSEQRRFAVVILAAGQGTRMRSDTHKVLHPIASRPLLLHLLERVDALGAEKRVVVVGKGRDTRSSKRRRRWRDMKDRS
jgi:bifunctional UDP-N-acetylglucosamine pyrophosphorylase/glucosamine-1-phosphate N-acetyltransferase